MSLRARLVTVLAVVLAMVVGLAVVVVAVQRDRLYAQLDDRLVAIAPLQRPGDDPTQPAPEGEPRDAQPGAPRGGSDDPLVQGSARRPISDVYIASVSPDGTVATIIEGQLLEAVVDTSGFAATPPDGRGFSTVDSPDGAATFRVLSEPSRDGQSTIVIAVPTRDVDQNVRRLVVTFSLVGGAIALTLGALTWWVWRLGLVPIARLTDTADAIAHGDRAQRVDELSVTTEAGQMARAINTMLDQRDEADDRLRQFVSDASHELRTPLSSIQGFLELYSAGGFRAPGEMDDAVRRMTDESNRMAGLVGNLLHLARMDEEQPLSIARTDIAELVRDVCADMGTAHPGRTVTASAPDVGELVAEVDAAKLRQLLTVLVDNALVHGPSASVEVEAHAEATQLVLTVVDDGPGMSSAEAERVFDRFYRGDSSRSRLRGGSGLGLAIAKMVAERHGGSISLDTTLGEGSSFAIQLPMAKSPGLSVSQ